MDNKQLITIRKIRLVGYFFLSWLSINSYSVLAVSNNFYTLEKYLNNINSVAIEFRQESSGQEIASGMLIINKPNQFRCNYYAPFPLLIVGNENYISIYDYELENITRVKPQDNNFSFLLTNQANFSDKVTLLAESVKGEQYIVKFQDNISEKISELAFNQKRKNIDYLKIFEGKEVITLYFTAYFPIKAPDKALFMLQNPNIFGQPARLNSESLKKKLGIL